MSPRRPSVVLLDAAAAVTFATLSTLKSIAGGAPIVLWVDVCPVEFVSQALARGVRGILRKSLPIELIDIGRVLTTRRKEATAAVA